MWFNDRPRETTGMIYKKICFYKHKMKDKVIYSRKTHGKTLYTYGWWNKIMFIHAFRSTPTIRVHNNN